MDRGVKSFKCCYHEVAHRVLRTVYRFYYFQVDFMPIKTPVSRNELQDRREKQNFSSPVRIINPTENISAD